MIRMYEAPVKSSLHVLCATPGQAKPRFLYLDEVNFVTKATLATQSLAVLPPMELEPIDKPSTPAMSTVYLPLVVK